MTTPNIDFATILASSTHDMKNSLCLLIQSIEQLSNKMRVNNMDEADELAQIHYEASRLNSNLLQMLSMYRAEKEALPICIDENCLDDVVENLIDQNDLYLNKKDIAIILDIEQELSWDFDLNLVSNLLNDIFVNAVRYCESKIIISAKCVNQELHITISDDGSGYPKQMLASSISSPQNIELNLSRTGLGLYFAQLIASAHSKNNKAGYIKLENGGVLNGSVFTLVLP